MIFEGDGLFSGLGPPLVLTPRRRQRLDGVGPPRWQRRQQGRRLAAHAHARARELRRDRLRRWRGSSLSRERGGELSLSLSLGRRRGGRGARRRGPTIGVTVDAATASSELSAALLCARQGRHVRGEQRMRHEQRQCLACLWLRMERAWLGLELELGSGLGFRVGVGSGLGLGLGWSVPSEDARRCSSKGCGQAASAAASYEPCVMRSTRVAILLPVKGRFRVSSSKSITPSAHTSDGWWYGSPLTSSGER